MSYVGKNPKFTNIRLLDNSGNAITHAVPSSVTPYTVTDPNAQGAAGTTYQNDGSGNLSWVTPGTVFAYVGTNPEPGGSSPFQLVTADHRTQIIIPAGAITVKLPTTSIIAGDIWEIENRSTNIVTIQSSGGTTIATLDTIGTARFVSLVNTPTAATDWSILSIQTQWASYTPTATDTTSTLSGWAVQNGVYRRISNTLEVKIDIQKDGSGGTGAGAFYVAWPSGYNLLTSQLPSSLGGNQLVGTWSNFDYAVSSQFNPGSNVCYVSGTTTNGFLLNRYASNAAIIGSTISANSKFWIWFTIPISQ